jgi:hypothetical protein
LLRGCQIGISPRKSTPISQPTFASRTADTEWVSSPVSLANPTASLKRKKFAAPVLVCGKQRLIPRDARDRLLALRATLPHTVGEGKTGSFHCNPDEFLAAIARVAHHRINALGAEHAPW